MNSTDIFWMFALDSGDQMIANFLDFLAPSFVFGHSTSMIWTVSSHHQISSPSNIATRFFEIISSERMIIDTVLIFIFNSLSVL